MGLSQEAGTVFPLGPLVLGRQLQVRAQEVAASPRAQPSRLGLQLRPGATPATNRPTPPRSQGFLRVVTCAPVGEPRSGKSMVARPCRSPSPEHWRSTSPGV